MNILHLEASPGWGGQEMRILHEAKGMRLRGHQMILGVMEGSRLIREACKAGFTVYPLKFEKRYWPICLFSILRMIRKHQIDLVNTHSSLDAWIGGIAARLSGRAVIRTRHLSTPIRRGWNSRILYGSLADFVVTTCSSVLPMICSQSGKKMDQCKSIPTGVDSVFIAKGLQSPLDFRSTLGIQKGQFLIGTACFMRSWKGISDFLKAAHLLRDVSEIKWVIIGGGHAEEYLCFARTLQLEGIVYFTGHLDNPFPALNVLDVFALLSTDHEGVSQAILQAAYLQKPLIATSTGGLGEVCIHEKTGLQVEKFSPYQVAEAVLRLKKDPLLCEKLGHHAASLVKRKFMLANTIDLMEEVFYTVRKNNTIYHK